jgi:hypothetical protein
MKITAFLDLSLSVDTLGTDRFGGKCCLHLQSFTLKLEAVRFSEILNAEYAWKD